MRRKNNTHRTEHIYITVDSVTNQCVDAIYNPQNEMLAFCKTKCSIRKTKRILLRVPS